MNKSNELIAVFNVFYSIIIEFKNGFASNE